MAIHTPVAPSAVKAPSTQIIGKRNTQRRPTDIFIEYFVTPQPLEESIVRREHSHEENDKGGVV